MYKEIQLRSEFVAGYSVYSLVAFLRRGTINKVFSTKDRGKFVIYKQLLLHQ